ncbi:hypothetical protein MNBD_GAMMA12-696 [hydrothermal vent metagenome]|uniref:Outer membrane protein assembly factor BamC n=1 Tax=hydrothermal vent metagenome TaxID=652676 RepID=A0A3B0Z2C4_9ZZZZ
MNKLFALLIVLLFSVVLISCGSKGTKSGKKGSKLNYKTSRKGKSLEVPPDLNRPSQNNTLSVPSSGTATLSGFKGKGARRSVASGSAVLPQQDKIKFVRNGSNYWLVVQGTPETVWGSVRQFWLQQGFILSIDNPTIGIMETDWAENRAKIAKGVVRRVIGKVFSGAYSSGLRDRFRIRLERGKNEGSTELFISHKGMKEEVQGGSLSPTGTVWKPRKRDVELEVEMLKRIMVYIGVSKNRVKKLAKNATTKGTSSIAYKSGKDDEGAFVDVGADFTQAWQVVGLALDRTGFNVVDRNRSKGIYFVKYNDPEHKGKKRKGFFKMFKSKKKKGEALVYQVKIVSSDNSSRVRVFAKDGSTEKSSTGKRIITLLKENLK